MEWEGDGLLIGRHDTIFNFFFIINFYYHSLFFALSFVGDLCINKIEIVRAFVLCVFIRVVFLIFSRRWKIFSCSQRSTKLSPSTRVRPSNEFRAFCDGDTVFRGAKWLLRIFWKNSFMKMICLQRFFLLLVRIGYSFAFVFGGVRSCTSARTMKDVSDLWSYFWLWQTNRLPKLCGLEIIPKFINKRNRFVVIVISQYKLILF